MSRGARLALFLVSAAGFLAVFIAAARGLPTFGRPLGLYGPTINASTQRERRVTDAVTAVNFDYRGVDTMGEEFILFASVAGAVLLLRKQSKEVLEESDKSARREAPPPSDATRALTLALVGPTVLFGLYVVLHGQLTPGGGFQGGVVLATAPLLVYLAGDFKRFKRISSHAWVEAAEAAGVFSYVCLGLFGLARGGAFLLNALPLGALEDVFSGGTIYLLNMATGLAVAAGFVLLLEAFLEEAIERRSR